MESTDEPITPYGLMFGEPGDWMMILIEDAFTSLDDRTLPRTLCFGTVMSLLCESTFGDDDMRTKQVKTTTFLFLAREMERRGMPFPGEQEVHAGFQEWCHAMRAGDPEADIIPTARLHALHQLCREGLERANDPAEFPHIAFAEMVDVAATLLRRRGEEPKHDIPRPHHHFDA